jgi:hypothetical protein
LNGGFNPLAAVPGETEANLVGRWQRWFQGMGVQPQSLELLPQARQAGVEDLPGLRKWLKQEARGGNVALASSLASALYRLAADPGLREWLEWPANNFNILPAGALFFACKAESWERRQLLRGVLLAALNVPEVRLVLYAFPWEVLEGEELKGQETMILSNGPLLPGSVTILVESSASQASTLSDRFLDGDARLGENLRLLAPGEGIVLVEGEAVFTSWRAGGKASQTTESTLQENHRDV